MSRRRGTGRGAVVRRRGFVLVLALAVMLMHTVVSGHPGAGSAASGPSHAGAGSAASGPEEHDSGMSHHADHSALTASSTMIAAPEMAGTDDCGEHSHDCVFIRASGVDLPAVVLVLLVWSLAVLPRIADTARRRTTVLGRPPPWAVYSHLQLQVIRC
ncbi:hypothetical protein [Gordonia lacunae]|uniref:Uncharacterized protein n=1 Tax=Gordonia lacunae TaxID=417102 RepID=A0A243QEL4_9ACTN|nr:hypothetical protein [Gordonia lacunae]OUC80073.1 hypothetical protein CA982_05115 [Gordonia lacunae]